MSSNRSSVIIKALFTLATFSALISLFLLYTFVSTAEERALKSLDSAKVLVATKILPEGTSLRSALDGNLIEERSYPVQSVPKNSLQKIELANENLVALAEIRPGQILLVESFAEKVPPKVELSPEVGKVAVTVELGYGARLGTFLRPGVIVSLFGTYTDEKTGKKTTSLLYEQLEVLAIGDQVTQDAIDAKDSASNFVTFAVEINRANFLIEAAQSASLYLALPSSSAANKITS